jgi:hypothetical protein
MTLAMPLLGDQLVRLQVEIAVLFRLVCVDSHLAHSIYDTYLQYQLNF